MVLRKATLQAALEAVADDASKYFLQAVQVCPDGRVIATNGHILFVVQEVHRFADADFPSKDLPAYGAELTQPITLTRDQVLRLVKHTKTGRTPIPILDCILIALDTDGQPYAAVTDLDTPLVVRPATGDDAPRFPNYERVLIAPTEGDRTVTLGAEVLSRLIKAGKQLRGKREAWIKLTIPDTATWVDGKLMSALRLSIHGDDASITGAVMPGRD